MPLWKIWLHIWNLHPRICWNAWFSFANMSKNKRFIGVFCFREAKKVLLVVKMSLTISRKPQDIFWWDQHHSSSLIHCYNTSNNENIWEDGLHCVVVLLLLIISKLENIAEIWRNSPITQNMCLSHSKTQISQMKPTFFESYWHKLFVKKNWKKSKMASFEIQALKIRLRLTAHKAKCIL